VNTIERFVGTYEGAGVWHDAAGKSLAYRVQQTSLPTANGFEIAFKHDLDDGTVTDARFNMTWLAPHIFRVDVSGTPIGHGYIFDAYCHYHLKVGDTFVEASYRANDDAVEVFGSSTKNADGNYIAWKEIIRRTAA
jgi:hypothetical protein